MNITREELYKSFYNSAYRYDLTWPPDERTKGFLEGYALARWNTMFEINPGIDGHSKSYDPLRIYPGRDEISSYVLNMKTGSRGHPLVDFKDAEEVLSYIHYELDAKNYESDEDAA